MDGGGATTLRTMQFLHEESLLSSWKVLSGTTMAMNAHLEELRCGVFVDG
jgi:hypothetical protein